MLVYNIADSAMLGLNILNMFSTLLSDQINNVVYLCITLNNAARNTYPMV